jgi:hypothetical protein|tara:strand:+ start:188 stop:292 length:105 start_codon:yes stop_codon:yes gene_type:complete
MIVALAFWEFTKLFSDIFRAWESLKVLMMVLFYD